MTKGTPRETEGTPREIAERRLPIPETAGAVCATVFSLRRHVVKAASIPLLLSIALQQGLAWETDEGFIWIAGYLAYLVPYTMFAVAWHRLVLLGPESAAPTFVPRWQSRNWRFLICLAVLELIVVVAPILVAQFSFGDFDLADGEVEEVEEEDFDLFSFALFPIFLVSALLGTLLFMAPLTYVWARFSFVFPATALDQDFGFIRSWRETREHGLRLTALMIFLVAPYIAAFLALYLALPVDCQETPAISETAGNFELGCIAVGSLPVTVIENTLYYILIAFTVTLLSIAFRTCTGWVPDAGGSPLAPAPGNGENSGERG